MPPVQHESLHLMRAPCVPLQHNGLINPRGFEMGVKQPKQHATMGIAVGDTVISPASYTRKHTGSSCVSGGA